MMKFGRILIAALAGLAVPAFAQDAPADLAFFKARVIAVAKFHDPAEDHITDVMDRFYLDNTWILTLRPDEPLLGTLPRGDVSVRGTSAPPAVGTPYYVLARSQGGADAVLLYNPVAAGFCLDESTARRYALEDHLKAIHIPCRK